MLAKPHLARKGLLAMGLFNKDIKTFDDLLLHGLQDIYYAEQQIVKALPKLIEKATNRDLTKGLKDHLEETKNQITRLDQAFKKLGQTPKGIRCPGIDGLITEGDEIAGEVATGLKFDSWRMRAATRAGSTPFSFALEIRVSRSSTGK